MIATVAGSTRPAGSASSATNSETVNGMPATTPAARTCPRRTPSGRRPNPHRSASSTATAIPSGLPTIRETRIPSPSRPVTASASACPESRTPAFASAKSGTITKLDQGSSSASARAKGETVSLDRRARSSHWAASASGGTGSSRVRSAIRRASSRTCRGRWNATAGVRNASTTPASVGAIPPTSSATHDATPRATYTSGARTPIRHSDAYATKSTNATSSGTGSTSLA